MTSELFFQQFKYDPPGTPSDIYQSGVFKPKLKAYEADQYWYLNDENSDKEVNRMVIAAVIHDPDTNKYYRARIDLAYNAYRGKDVYQNDGIYLDIMTASYLAQFNL